MGQYQQPQYPHSPEAYGTPAGSPPPQQQYQQPPPQQQHYQEQPIMNSQPQQPAMAYQQPNEKQQHAPAGAANAYQGQQGSKFGNKWTFGFWDCFSPLSTCCFTCWCPCFVFGRTYDREHGNPNSSGCGLMCCAWYCAAHIGVTSCLQCIIRGQTRERYGIEGDAFTDFAGACCCPCCALLQEEKESIVRHTGIDPTTQQPYQPVGGMNYNA